MKVHLLERNSNARTYCGRLIPTERNKASPQRRARCWTFERDGFFRMAKAGSGCNRCAVLARALAKRDR